MGFFFFLGSLSNLTFPKLQLIFIIVNPHLLRIHLVKNAALFSNKITSLFTFLSNDVVFSTSETKGIGFEL